VGRCVNWSDWLGSSRTTATSPSTWSRTTATSARVYTKSTPSLHQVPSQSLHSNLALLSPDTTFVFRLYPPSLCLQACERAVRL
jgi:hypothetical protein